jgi:hypothetical protein
MGEIVKKCLFFSGLMVLFAILFTASLLVYVTDAKSVIMDSNQLRCSGSLSGTSMGIENGSHSYLYQTENNSVVVIAGENRSVQIEIQPDNIEPQTGAPGSPLVWLVVVKNTGNVPENYTLTVNELLGGVSLASAPRIGWGATLDDTILVLNPGEKAATYLRVTVPSDAKTSEWDAIKVIVTGVGAEDSYTVRAQVLEPGPRTNEGVIDISVDAPVISIEAWPNQYSFGLLTENDTVATGPNYFTLRNTGNVVVSVYVVGTDAQSMPGEPTTTWTLDPVGMGPDHYTMLLDNITLSKTNELIWGYVAPDTETQFGLTVRAPTVITRPARMYSSFKLTAMVTDYRPSTVTPKPTTATVSLPFVEETEGTMVTVPVTITNNSSVWDNFSLSVCDSNGWTPSLSTTMIGLDNGASTKLNLTVNLPPSTGGQIDTVTITAKSSNTGNISRGENQIKSSSLLSSEVTIPIGCNVAHCSVVNKLVDPCFRYDPLTIGVEIQNKSILDHDYLLTLVTENTDLGLKLTPDELFLPAGDTGYAALSVTIPDDWWAGWSGTVTVVATPKPFGKSGRIEIRKVDEENKLLDGATFKVQPNPYGLDPLDGTIDYGAGGAFLLVTDGGAHDSDPSDGVVLLEDVPVGTYTITEYSAPPGYTGDNTVNVFDVTPNATVPVTWVDKPVTVVVGRVEIRKMDEENKLLGGATFRVSPNPYGAGDLLVTDGGARDSDPIPGIVLLEDVPVGAYIVTENVAPSGYQGDNTAATVSVTPSYSVAATFVDKLAKNPAQVTRTQGFWATHVAFTENVWSCVDNKMIGTKTIDDNGKLFGVFWSNLAKMSDGGKRTSLDRARMQMLQQLVAAILNVTAFGDDGTGAALISAGKTAFIGTNEEVILNVVNQLDIFNQSGDSSSLPPGVFAGPADPNKAKAIANIPFWDTLTMTVTGVGQYESSNFNSFGTNRTSTPAPTSGISKGIIVGIAIAVICGVIGCALSFDRKH